MSDPYKDDAEVHAESEKDSKMTNEKAQLPESAASKSSEKKNDASAGVAHAAAAPMPASATAQKVLPTREGEVRKFAIARSVISRHNWKTRHFVLSPENHGIRYYAPAGASKKEGGDGKGKDDDDDDDDSESYDEDADPDRDAAAPKEARAKEARAPVQNHPSGDGRKCKGEVYLDKRSRLITKPSASLYKINSSDASDELDIGIIFFEGPQATKERRLIFQCKSKKDYADWILALAEYIYTIDDPSDYSDKDKGKDKDKDKRKDLKK